MRIAARSGAVLAAAAAVLVSNTMVTAPPALAGTKVHCLGVNACKGKGVCKTVSNACQGHNACKGKGAVSLSKSACLKKGGKVG